MKIEQLEYMVEIAKTGSLSKAAANLNITLSAVSQSISNLESELGILLFHRSHLGATPTPEGLIILKKAYHAMSILQEIKMDALNFSEPQFKEISVSSIPGLMPLALNTIKSIKRDYPQTQIIMAEKNMAEITEDIRQQKVDIGLTILFDDYLFENKQFLTGRLFDSKLVLVVSRKSFLARYKSISIDELLKLPLVIHKTEILQRMLGLLTNEFGPLNILFYTNHSSTIQRLVHEDFAATIAMDIPFRHNSSIINKEFTCIEIEFSRWRPLPVGWVCSKDKLISEPAKIFLARLEEDFSKS
ncbi:LysR family transcriptional regulator [Neobacillus sp. MER 74]|uniref:LysR family transcriptional regulator n=1 Tax=Neobacillus sp. MER 74 TaxID=2939566 RepID=UPI00203DC275|nr:LysR family transcriptional regulator [Neobacillus sp. MER 74]MCM3113735.1 LysR family transcriptional regulator [Neobacillus sp. MER 74]